MPRADAIRLDEVRADAANCTRCDLYRNATQTVFGEGPVAAWLMLVGEQPGDREDVAGKPFVGPAGHLLDRALDEVGIDRTEVYLTNAVKHFRWERSGKRRLHKTPGTEHVRACRLWLDQELELVAPSVVVCLGSVAAKALLGAKFRVTRDRGKFLPWPGEAKMLATVHPSSVLRSDDRDAAYAAFLGDLQPVVEARPG